MDTTQLLVVCSEKRVSPRLIRRKYIAVEEPRRWRAAYGGITALTVSMFGMPIATFSGWRSRARTLVGFISLDHRRCSAALGTDIRRFDQTTPPFLTALTSGRTLR